MIRAGQLCEEVGKAHSRQREQVLRPGFRKGTCFLKYGEEWAEWEKGNCRGRGDKDHTGPCRLRKRI